MGGRSAGAGDLADDGKRFDALDVAFCRRKQCKGRESEGGEW